MEQVNRLSTGFSEIADYLTGITDGIPKTPEWAEKQCGIASDEIVQLYPLAAARPAPFTRTPIHGFSEGRIPTVCWQCSSWRPEILEKSAAVPRAVEQESENPRCGRLSVPPTPAESSVPVNSWADAVLAGPGDSSDFQRPSPLDLLGSGNYAVQSMTAKRSVKALMSVNTVISRIFPYPLPQNSPILSFSRKAMFPERDRYLLYQLTCCSTPAGRAASRIG